MFAHDSALIDNPSGDKVPTTRLAAAMLERKSSKLTTRSSVAGEFKGCATYADFRELLEKEKDVTAVKVMTPDHTHAAISHGGAEEGVRM